MRLFPVNKAAAAFAFCLALAPALAGAQQDPAQARMTPQQEAQLQQMVESLYSGLPPRDATAPGSAVPESYAPLAPAGPERKTLTPEEYAAALADQESPQSHANRLADQAQRKRELERSLKISPDASMPPPPQDLEDLQDVKKNTASGDDENMLADVADGEAEIDVTLNLRRDAQKDAALSFGARGGLAKRNYEIMQRLQSFENTLDNVFDFRALLVRAPSGLLIEPPIVRESLDSLVITGNGDEAAVVDRVLDINKDAKIVSAPRDWRLYLIQTWTSRVPKPPKLLWPRTAAEQEEWNDWVAKGWQAGVEQADDMFESNLARLVADYNGMVRYRMLLTQGMISQPYAMHEDRGVTGGKTVMRVGDRALRITGPSQFLTGSDLWKPADR